MEIIQTREGEPREISGKWGRNRRTVIINREYSVRDDAGHIIGGLRYVMITRERRTPGKRYVNARWESPGWQFFTGEQAPTRWGAWREAHTKKYALQMMELNAPQLVTVGA